MLLLPLIDFLHSLRFRFRSACAGERGVTTTEYAIMMVLIAIAVAGSTPGVRNAVVNTFVDLSNTLNVAGASSP